MAQPFVKGVDGCASRRTVWQLVVSQELECVCTCKAHAWTRHEMGIGAEPGKRVVWGAIAEEPLWSREEIVSRGGSGAVYVSGSTWRER